MRPEVLLPVLFVLAFGAIAAVAVLAWRAERRRREALAARAASLGLSFAPARDRSLAQRHREIRGLDSGDDRYAYHVLDGRFENRRITAFDFHYSTESTDSEGKSSTTHHRRHVVLLDLEQDFPALHLAPEGVLSKLAQAVGFEDIDFESFEFSRRFCVRSPERKFAYDFCNPRMMEFLLDRPSTRLEIRDHWLAFVREGPMVPDLVEPELRLACTIRDLMPAYLFAT